MGTKKVRIFEKGENQGFLGDNQNWWFNSNFEHSFQIFDIDYFYEENYFKDVFIAIQKVNKEQGLLKYYL